MNRAVHLFLLILLGFPLFAQAQSELRRMVVERQTTDRIFVARDYPEKAAVLIVSSIPGLQVGSNMGTVADLSEAGTGEYRVIIEPIRQTLYIDAPGFIRATFATGNIGPRDVIYLFVEPEDRSITDTGVLLIRTQPEGATIRIAGFPGEFISPHTFDPILAQTHSVQIELEDYEIENLQFRVESNRPRVETVVLTPRFGFVRINAPNSQLFLQSEGFSTPSRVTFTLGQPLKLSTGEYTYRLERPFYKPVSGSLTISPGTTASLNPEFEPDFAEFHVSANVRGFRLTAADNNAPASTGSSMLYLEPGIRNVQVSAPGYQPVDLQLRVVSGTRIDTTITLLTPAQIEDRRQREALPRGILELSSDLSDARIYVNGQNRGEGNVSLSLTPGLYHVEYRHALGNRRVRVQVPPAEFVSHTELMRPSRSTTLIIGAVVPGGGHLYTRRNRGYLYLGLAAAAAGFTYYMHTEFQRYSNDYDSAVLVYQQATFYQDAIAARQRADALFAEKNQAFDRRLIGIGAVAGIHLLQYLDVLITRPLYGYRHQTASMSIVPDARGGMALSFSMDL